MKKEELKEGNKLIAEFMGLSIKNNIVKATEDIKSYNERCLDGYNISMASYHNSWDWLMPIVEKIEDMDVVASFQIEQPTIYIWTSSKEPTFTDIEVEIIGITKLEAVYIAVLQFIEWYNKKLKS